MLMHLVIYDLPVLDLSYLLVLDILFMILDSLLEYNVDSKNNWHIYAFFHYVLIIHPYFILFIYYLSNDPTIGLLLI